VASDFFLQNRAHQIHRLCRVPPIKFELPRQTGRKKLPGDLADFAALTNRICDLAEGSEQATPGFNEQVRADLQNFERDLVRLRFSKDDSIKQPAVQFIKAIFADANYFSGLKPLPQYTDTFAYERLFPSWLNLLTATMLPQASNGKPRLDGNRQGALFAYLSKVKGADSELDELVGLLTFVAARFDAPVCEELLQRMCDLYSLEGAPLIASLNSIEQISKNARQFAAHLRDYLTAKHSLHRWPSERSLRISYARPAVRVLPQSIEDLLTELEEKENWTEFLRVAGSVRRLVESEEFLATDFVSLLKQHPNSTAELLKLVIRDEGPVHILSDEAQRCLAFLIAQEYAETNKIPWEAVSNFTDSIAERMHRASEDTLAFFKAKFLSDGNRRKTMLSALGSDSEQQKLTDSILARAAKEDDDKKFIAWLFSAAMISPDQQAERAGQAVQAIEAVLQNRSIGNREFADLIADLKDNMQEALTTLASPMRAAGGKSPRLAALYMTLNEISETLAATGKVDNFSVVRAKYARLTNLDLD
jgi:hypothetical protein